MHELQGYAEGLFGVLRLDNRLHARPYRTVPDRTFERPYWGVEGNLIAGCYPGSLDRIETGERLSCYDASARELAKERGLPISFSRSPTGTLASRAGKP